MHINHDANTYAGQEARIIHVSTTGTGRKLYALKTCATRPVATAWDDPDALRRYAAGKLLDLQNERK
jgi:hypothetical protein